MPLARKNIFKILGSLPVKRRLDNATILRARKYAYHFFFRRMIPLEFVEPTGGWPPYNLKIENVSDLLPENSAGLDAICNGILKGSEFCVDGDHARD